MDPENGKHSSSVEFFLRKPSWVEEQLVNHRRKSLSSLGTDFFNEMSPNSTSSYLIQERGLVAGSTVSSSQSFVYRLSEKKDHQEADLFWLSLHDIGYSK